MTALQPLHCGCCSNNNNNNAGRIRSVATQAKTTMLLLVRSSQQHSNYFAAATLTATTMGGPSVSWRNGSGGRGQKLRGGGTRRWRIIGSHNGLFSIFYTPFSLFLCSHFIFVTLMKWSTAAYSWNYFKVSLCWNQRSCKLKYWKVLKNCYYLFNSHSLLLNCGAAEKEKKNNGRLRHQLWQR